MPGLSQLKQFNSDILGLGEEPKLRSARGEKPVTIKIPKNITIENDSDDFIDGMPEISEEVLQQAEAAAAEREKEKYNVDGLFGNTASSNKPSESSAAPEPAAPDVSDILDLGNDAAISDDDLSEFVEPEPEPEPEPKVTPIEDMDLDSLLAFSNDGTIEEDTDDESSESEDILPEPEIPVAKPKDSPLEPIPFPVPDPVPAAAPDIPAPVEDLSEPKEDFNSKLDSLASSGAPVSSDFDIDSAADDFTNTEDDSTLDLGDSLPDELKEIPDGSAASDMDMADMGMTSTDEALPLDAGLDMGAMDSFGDMPSAGDLPAVDEPVVGEESAASDAAGLDNFDIDSALSGTGASDDVMNADDGLPVSDTLPAEEASPAIGDDILSGLNLGDDEMSGAGEETGISASPDEVAALDIDALAGGSGDSEPLPSDDMASSDPLAALGDLAAMSDNPGAADAMPASGDLPDIDAIASGAGDASGLSEALPDIDQAGATGLEDMDLDNIGAEDESAAPAETEQAEQFDTSAMEGVDFDKSNSDFELSTGDDAGFGGGDEEFAIPGFSDTVTANLNKKPEPAPSAAVTDEEAAQKPKNTFTDAEYKIFLNNLDQYPLNVRVALEDFVVGNEFTDDAVFEVLEKVLKKVPARQLAAELEKKLDISIQVPRDFERRSTEEYEAYKKTIEYQLKNRILPWTIMGTAAAILLVCIFILSKAFVYNPLVAKHYYKQGYENLCENEYPLSEDNFNKALVFQTVKKWFFTYARGYREHHQYERARNMYYQILRRFKHDKEAGLEWARMESEDLFNYEEAERILKREVLDYYINDPIAILQLGDLYLDWATDKDPSKFDDAKAQYDLLLQLYGENKKTLPTYLACQMRYFIRIDNLAQVLQYKMQYFPDNKGLKADDLIEVSGYLLDKRYGNLTPSEENLRSKIEGLRDLLECAVKAAPDNPVALYNMGRYFVKTNNGPKGTAFFKNAIQIFSGMRYRNRKNTYKFIDTYRLLGEEYVAEKEYILAEEAYGKGIDLYEKENSSSGFEPSGEVGKLYEDMGDIDYFISGDMDVALNNYVKSVNCKNDTSSVRYRIGYIQYTNRNYPEALGSFIRSSENDPSDSHALLALSNTLSLRDDNYAAQGYYEKLLAILDNQRQLYKVILPQVREDQGDLVDTYMKATNNLGVTLSRIADITGNSKYNARAIVYLQESLRAWDALTRNQETMVRLEGSNLAEQNIKYITEPYAEFSPEIYTAIPKIKSNEEGL